MIGSQSTLGCIVFLRIGDAQIAIAKVLSALDLLVTVNRQEQKENKYSVKAKLGLHQVDGLVFALTHDTSEPVAVFVEFDEALCVLLANQREKPLEDLFVQYISALEKIPEAIAIGLGLEMSVPENFDNAFLEDAGIAVFFEQDKAKTDWVRRGIFQFTGLTESSLVAA